MEKYCGDLAVPCLGMGSFLLLAALGLLALAIAEWNRVPTSKNVLIMGLTFLVIGGVLLVAGFKMNKLRRR